MANTNFKAKPKTEDAPPKPVNALAPSRMPIVSSIAKEFDVTADQWRVLVDQIFPNARTVEAIGMALAYCRARNLDIFKRPVHIVPMYSSALKKMVETVWPGIAEIRTTAHRTGNYAGIDPVRWGEIMVREFRIEGEDEQRNPTARIIEVDFPEYAEVTVYRMVEGQRMPFTAQVFWEESYATAGRDTDLPNTMWQKRPRGQLAKCVEAAALRMAFPEELGNTYAAEEMEGRTIDAAVSTAAEITKPSAPALPEPDEPPPPPPKASGAAAPDPSAPPASGAATIADQAGDYNDDASDVSAERTPDEFLEDLQIWMNQQTTVEGIDETWSELDVESTFARDPERMGKAIDMKIAAVQRVEQKAGGKVFGARTDEEQAAIDKQVDDLFPGARGA